jgi:steroid delta-isomerase-like uncharacterized protein
MTTEDIVGKLVDVLNRHDARALTALYSQDAVSNSPTLRSRHAEGRMDKERQQKAYEGYFSAFPDLKIKISDLVARGNDAWFEFVFTGTHKGPFQSSKGLIPPTNKVVEWAGAWLVRTRGNLIAEESRYYDLTEWMAQLGPEPGS